MRTRIIVGVAVLFTAVLVLLTSANVFGCTLDEHDRWCGYYLADLPESANTLTGYWNQIQDPGDFIDSLASYWGTVQPPSTANLVAKEAKPAKLAAPAAKQENVANTSTTAKVAQPVVAPKPAVAKPPPAPAAPIAGSLDPNQAPVANADWVWIQPFTAVWYKADDRGRRLNVYLNANGQRGLTMDIFGPDQQNVWESKPVGKGVDGKGFDLFWTGRARMHGFWLIRLTNHNDFAVSYSLGATSIADKAGDLCRECHGIIEDEWDRCDHEGSFCEDLKNDYQNEE